MNSADGRSEGAVGPPMGDNVSMARFGTVLTAMVTPFGQDGSLDLPAAQILARWLVDHGSDGLVVSGTTGEAPVLSAAEHIDLWSAVREAVDVPVLAGTGSNDTAHTIEMSQQAAKVGVDALLVVTPYYNRPGPTGLAEHFRLTAAATDLPVMLYDIPARTGRKIPRSMLVQLGRSIDNIVAVKDAAGDPSDTAFLIAEAGDVLEVYSGDDSMTLPLLSVGAVGLVGVASHWAGPEHQEMVNAFRAGDTVRATEINQRLLRSFAFETGPEWPNPLPTKAMMRVLGLAVGECRPPMGAAPPSLEDDARAVLAELRGKD